MAFRETTQNTAGIILAAGMSNRMGRTKQLELYRGRHLISWAIQECLKSRLSWLYLVLGHDKERICKVLGDDLNKEGLTVVYNAEYRSGMSSSIKAGLSEVKSNYGSAMFLLADQPHVDAELINNLIDHFNASGKDICAPVCHDTQRNPTIFRDNLFDNLTRITGDVGAKKIIQDNCHRTCFVEVRQEVFFADVDTPADLEKLNSLSSPPVV